MGSVAVSRGLFAEELGLPLLLLPLPLKNAAGGDSWVLAGPEGPAPCVSVDGRVVGWPLPFCPCLSHLHPWPQYETLQHQDFAECHLDEK